MAVSKRHVNHVLDANGYQFVDPVEAPNLTLRYTETFLRRRLFAVEDESIIGIYQMYRQAFNDIRGRALIEADNLGIRKLDTDTLSVQWRRLVSDYMTIRLRELALQVARYAYDRVVLAYLASYYGKYWMLDSMTVDDVVRIPRISAEDASRAVMDKQMLEDVGNRIIYDAMGREWREQYRDQLDEVIIRIRRRMSTGMGNGEDIPTLMNGIADLLGVDIDGRRVTPKVMQANFNRVQAITRSHFIDANNRASLAVYQRNDDIVQGVQWLTAQDNRVCPQCQALAWKTWDVNDINMKHPVSDTHLLCRCTHIPVLYDDIETVPDEAPPSTKFTDWLIGFGLGILLQEFIGRQLDSTRI